MAAVKVYSSALVGHLLLLLLWIAVGAGLRFAHLASEPLGTDEFATLVFSLGHSFRSIPLDQVISSQVLLQPLAPSSPASVGAVVHNLLAESNHPPLYFVLTHWWLQLFPLEQADTLVWAARALSALFGVLTIPAVFGLGYLAFRSALVGQLCAALMAVSPFGIYLAQEARHYTLPILWGIASLGCLVVATRRIEQQRKLPLGVGLLWVLVNSLGIATHYFFAFGLMAQGLVLLGQGLKQSLRNSRALLESYWWRVYGVAAGTLAAGLVWVPVWNNIEGSDLTEWIIRSDRLGFAWLEPLLQTLASWMTMVFLLPVEGVGLPTTVISGLTLLVLLVWSVPIFYRGLKVQFKQSNASLTTQVLGGFVVGAISIFFGLTYGLGIDLLLIPRYNFVYFPAVIVLLGASLAGYWSVPPSKLVTKRSRSRVLGGKQTVILIWTMALVGGLMVTWNLGYYKTQRPELVAPIIQSVSKAPVLIATAHRSHSQARRMMGLAWELKSDPQGMLSSDPVGKSISTAAKAQLQAQQTAPQFLLAHQDHDPQASVRVLLQTLRNLSRPLDLWLVNFPDPEQLETQNCYAASESTGKGGIDGYDYQLYHCLKKQ